MHWVREGQARLCVWRGGGGDIGRFSEAGLLE